MGWTDGGTYVHFFNWHLIYPGLADSRIQYVQDVKVVNGYIYVLADVQQTWAGLGRQDVYLYTFTEAGRLLGEQRVFGIGNGSSGTTGDSWDFYGTALVPVSNSRIIVVAHAITNGANFVAASRVLIATAGPSTGTTSTDQAWGTPYNGNTGNRYFSYFGPSTLCTTGMAYCEAVPAAATKAEGFSDNDIYVAGSVKYNSANDWDVFTLKFSGETGAANTGYSGDGWTRHGFDMPNTDNNDQARGLYVYQNEIWVAATVNRRCQTGIGVLKLNSTGATNSAFGTEGRVVFGGSDGSICIQGAPGYDVAGMSATPGRMGIVGRVQRGPLIGSPAIYNPALGVVDAATGEVLSLDDYAVTYADYEPTPGTRMGDGFLYDVLGVGDPFAGYAFTVVGDARNSSQGNRFRYVVGRMIPTSTDTLFKNGFD